MVFDPNSEILLIPQPLRVTTESLNLQAASAQLNIANDQHIFRQVKAVYDDRRQPDAS
jgi:hypothetical protein